MYKMCYRSIKSKNILYVKFSDFIRNLADCNILFDLTPNDSKISDFIDSVLRERNYEKIS